MLAPYPPYPPRSGGALRIYHLLAGLARHHELWLLTFAPDDAAAAALEPLRTVCHVETVTGLLPRRITRRAWDTLFSPLPDMALRNASTAYTDALRQLVRSHPFDAIQAESIEMGGYGVLARALVESGGKPAPALVLDEFNAEYVLQRRAARLDLLNLAALLRTGNPKPIISGSYSLLQSHKLAHYERWLLRGYSAVLAVSEEDRHALHRLCPEARIRVVPNGVDTRFFAPDPSIAPSVPPSLVFTGSLDFRPNVDAVRWFAHQVLPLIRTHRPDARFVVVGRSPSPAVLALHNDAGVEVVGEVADVRPSIVGAAVYVVPMRIGGGVRLKLLEALAMQAPIVSTPMGAEGIIGLHDGEHLLLAETPAAFAAAVLRLLENPAEGQRMGRAGRLLVSERYDWQTIVPLLNGVYEQMRG